MNEDFEFFKTSMPLTRKADYYLGCLDGSIFIDFNRTIENHISLVRISFDRYGCCNLDDKGLSLNKTDSEKFIKEMESEHLNQKTIFKLVKEIIEINKDHIWIDAIEEYKLI
ncbi:hypothetical protein ACFO3O_00700 [Dokdonia ponticola]|uniref:His-Xaa-Ser system protein HxsD n=1 Tax=Dokdonia ponticola TaxID=2041041 RepID=A0ABV9HQE6_9FLAO